jgi:hypothetical protein
MDGSYCSRHGCWVRQRVRQREPPSEGERNGNYRHGFYTAEAMAERRDVRALLRKLG